MIFHSMKMKVFIINHVNDKLEASDTDSDEEDADLSQDEYIYNDCNKKSKSTKELNKIFKRNQIKENDHIQTLLTVLNEIQDIVEYKQR